MNSQPDAAALEALVGAAGGVGAGGGGGGGGAPRLRLWPSRARGEQAQTFSECERH